MVLVLHGPSLAARPGASLDSLRSALRTAKDSPSEWRALVGLSQAFRQHDPDSSMYFLQKALTVSLRAGSLHLEGNTWRAIAELHVRKGAFAPDERWWDSARVAVDHSIAAHTAVKDTIGLVTTLSQVGLFALDHSIPLAVEWGSEARRLLTPSVVAQWEAAEPRLQRNLARSRSYIHETLGWSYLQLGRIAEARHELEQALELSTAHGLFLFGLRGKLMDVAEAMNDHALTIRMGRELLNDLARMKVAHGQLEYRSKLIRAFVQQDRCDSAMAIARTALVEASAEQAQGGHGPYDLAMVHAAMAFCEARSGDRSAALGHLRSALHAYGTLEEDESRMTLAVSISAALAELGSHRQALELRDTAYALERRLLGRHARSLVVQYQEHYDAQRKEYLIQQLEQESRIRTLSAERAQRRAVMTAGGAFLVLTGAGLWFRTDRRRRRERFEREAAQLETQALRSQMNPHFIFNALNSIHAYIQQQDPDRAGSFVTKFARVMRSVLENSRHAEVPLRDDLDTLRAYMDLERQRSGAFDYSIEVAPEVDPDEVMVPPLVVQPFVENAIWHGMAGKQDKGHITLRVERRGGQLTYIVEDDGVGRKAAPPTPQGHPIKKTSLGTAITRGRLDLVQKQHGGKAGFRYVDTAIGTRVEVEMPLLTAT